MAEPQIFIDLGTEASLGEAESRPISLPRRRFLQGIGVGAAGALSAAAVHEIVSSSSDVKSVARTEGITVATEAARTAFRLANRYNSFLLTSRYQPAEAAGKQITVAMLHGRVEFLRGDDVTWAISQPLLATQDIEPLDSTNKNSFWLLHQEEQFDGTGGFAPFWLGDQPTARVVLDPAQPRSWEEVCLGTCEPTRGNPYGIGVLATDAASAGLPSPGLIVSGDSLPLQGW